MYVLLKSILPLLKLFYFSSIEKKKIEKKKFSICAGNGHHIDILAMNR